MPLIVYQVTLGAGATQITTDSTSAQEIHLNPAAHDYTFGLSDVSATKYFAKVATPGTAGNTYATVIGQGPAAISIEKMRNCYLFGTQNDVVNVGVVLL